MTSLAAVASYLPETRVSVEDLADSLELTHMEARLFRRYHQLSHVALAPETTVLDLLLAAVSKLDALRGQEHRVRYVLYARGFPVVVPYPHNPVYELCQRVGLGHASGFTVTHHACASGLLAIDLAGKLVAADPDPDALALVLAGEKTFTQDARMVPETTIFGEGSAACLISADGPRDRLLSYAVSQRGDFDDELTDSAVLYQREYRAELAEAIVTAVRTAGLRLDDIALILPHNVNIVAWRRLCRALDYPVERVLLDNVATTGHTFCADAFINYRAARERGRLRPGDRYLVGAAGAGRGATFSAMVFEH